MIQMTTKLCSSGLCFLLSGLLSLTLLAQITIITFHYSVGAIQIPQSIVAKVNQQLSQEGLELQIESAKVDLGGNIVIDQARLIDQKNKSQLIEADYLYAKISRISLLFGKVIPIELQIHQAKINQITSLLSTGQTNTLLSKLSLAVRKTETGWTLIGLSAELDNLEIYLAGTISNDAPDLFSSITRQIDAKEKIHWREHYNTTQERLIHFFNKVNISPSSSIECRFSANSNEIYFQDAFASAQHVQWEDKVSLSEFSFLATGSWSPQEHSFRIKHLHAEKLHATPYQLQKLSLRTQITNSLIRSDLSAQVLQTPELTVDDINGLFQYDLQSQDTRLNAIVSLDHKKAALQAEYNLANKDGQIDFQSSTSPRKWYNALPRNPLPPLIRREVEKLQDRGQWFYHGKVTFSNNQPTQAKVHLQVYQGQYGSVLADAASASIEWKDKILDISNIKSKAQQNQVSSRVLLDFNKKDGFLDIKGTIVPSLIDEFMPRWWDIVWRNFTIPANGVTGDFYVQFPLEIASRYQVFGSASGNNAIYNKMEVDHGSCKVYVIPRFVDVYDMNLRRPEGVSTGDIQWIFERGQKNPYATHFSVNSNFYPRAWYYLIGEPVDEIIQGFRSNHAPKIDVKGVWYGSHTPKKDDTNITIQANSPNPISFKTIDCSSLSLLAEINRERADLKNIQANLCEGTFAGDFSFLFTETDNFSINGELEKVNYTQFKSILDDSDKENKVGGLLSANIQADGTFQNWSSFTGMLSINLQDANIARLPLLGFLSQISTIANVKIQQSSADFTINRNILTTKNLLLSGPTTQIKGSGSYGIAEDSINFKLNVLPLKQLPLLAPLSMVLEVDLFNTLDDPKWRFRNNPLNMIRSAPKQIEQTPTNN